MNAVERRGFSANFSVLSHYGAFADAFCSFNFSSSFGSAAAKTWSAWFLVASKNELIRPGFRRRRRWVVRLSVTHLLRHGPIRRSKFDGLLGRVW